MYEVMMRCPNSLQEGPLGMEVEGLENWEAITFVRSLYLCGSCGRDPLGQQAVRAASREGQGPGLQASLNSPIHPVADHRLRRVQAP